MIKRKFQFYEVQHNRCTQGVRRGLLKSKEEAGVDKGTLLTPHQAYFKNHVNKNEISFTQKSFCAKSIKLKPQVFLQKSEHPLPPPPIFQPCAPKRI
jgi:hypothetical protein